MISERSNKGKEKLIEDGDHNPSQNNLPGSQNFGGGSDLSGSRATEAAFAAAVASCSHSAPKKERTDLLPLSEVIDQINPHRLQWTEKLHNHFVRRGESQKSTSNGASTNSREHGRNGPGMGDQKNVGGNLETGTVTTPLNSAQQQPHDSNLYISLEQIQNHLEMDERSRTVSAVHQQPSQVEVADISAANGGSFMTSNGYSFPRPYNIPTSSTAINNVQVGLQEQTPGFQAQWLLPAQYGVGLQMQTPGFQNHNGFYYNFHQPGNEAHWFHPAQYGVGLQVQTPGFQHQNGAYNFQPAQVGVGLQEQTLGFQHQNGVYNFQPTQVGVGLQEQTLGFHHQNGVYNFQPAQVAVGLPEQTLGFQHQNGVYNFQPGNELARVVQPTQYSVGVLVQTPSLQYQSGFYNFQPGNELARMVQPTQYGVGIQEQTPGLQYQNRVNNFQPGNELACMVQPAQYGVGLQEQTPGFQYQHGVYNFQPGNELACMVQPTEDGVPSRLYNQNEVYNIQAGNETHIVQQPAHDGGALANIQQQNQPQAATDTVQAQNATAIMPDNMVTTEDLVEDFLNLDSSELGIADFEIDYELALVVQPAEDGVPSRLYNQNEVYNIQAGNETHMVQQPAHDGGALANIQQQNQPQAATDTVQAQNATAIMLDNMVTTEDLVKDFLNLDSSELGMAGFDFSEPFGFAGLPL